MGIHSRKGGLTFAQIERKTPVPRPALQSKQSSLCSLHCNEDRGREGPNGQIVSVKRAADWRGREAGRSLMKREKYRAKSGFLQNTSTDLKGANLVILISHASAPVREKRLSPTSKARREASRNEFMEKGEMPD